MIILSSSGKTLDFETPFTEHVKSHLPAFQKQANELMNEMAGMDLPELQATLHSSEKIAILNYQRVQSWDPTGEKGRAMLYAYNGDVFRQLKRDEYGKAEQEYADKNVFVASGLYGVVSGMDRIQPYRLEMDSKLPKEGKMNEFWQSDVTSLLNQKIAQEGHTHLLNLASKNYSASVDAEQLNCPIINVEFKEMRDGKLKIIALFAKQARGMMIDYCIRNKVQSPEDLKAFTEGGYSFQGQTGNTLLFTR